MTEDQIKYMTDRFLQWKLPEDFSPDAGISFKKTFNENTPRPMKHEPIGTNLFDAQQAKAMVLYMVDGMSPQAAAPGVEQGLQKHAQRALELERIRDALELETPEFIAASANLQFHFAKYGLAYARALAVAPPRKASND